jgi:hypothetical protein
MITVVSYHLTLFLARVISFILKKDVTLSSETSVYNKPIQRNIPEDVFFIVTTVETSNPT